MSAGIPLSLYVHLPWCIRKCPYCDFNSHAVRAANGEEEQVPEAAYVGALVADLDQDLRDIEGRTLTSIFFGGGTPSLFSPQAIGRIIDAARARLDCSADIEITLEANPGTVEQSRFEGYRDAGVNRLSLGIQSFNDRHLQALGRIHGADEARRAVNAARAAGFDNFNLDLMYALPRQSVEEGRADLEQAVALGPTHVSYYQLTLEPNTLFHQRPPPLPNDETAWAMHVQGEGLFAQAGYAQYEISAYAQPGRQCRHNRNYWEFGDYLGIGAGAHAKITDSSGRVRRSAKKRHPRDYLATAATPDRMLKNETVAPQDLPLEFLMNGLRLNDGVELRLLETRAGLKVTDLQPALDEALSDRLLELRDGRLLATALGRRHLDTVLARFLPDRRPTQGIFDNKINALAHPTGVL